MTGKSKDDKNYFELEKTTGKGININSLKKNLKKKLSNSMLIRGNVLDFLNFIKNKILKSHYYI